MIWQLCGVETRNTCTAGYKAIVQDGNFPAQSISPRCIPHLADVVETKMKAELAPLGERAGGLTDEAAQWTGLKPGIAVAVANVDAHVTVPAAQVIEPGRMVMIMGTSTCHMVMRRSAARGGGHVRRGGWRHHPRAVRLRGRAERRRRYLRLVRR